MTVNAALGYINPPAEVDGTCRLDGVRFTVFIEDRLLFLELPVWDQYEPA
jgi:hypothetical protein